MNSLSSQRTIQTRENGSLIILQSDQHCYHPHSLLIPMNLFSTDCDTILEAEHFGTLLILNQSLLKSFQCHYPLRT